MLIEHGQTWEDRGEKGWRRVVASPEPLEVLETHTLLTLLDAGYVVVAAGGGGIPVVRTEEGKVRGIEAVIDKDLTAAVLARSVEADALVIATDVENAVIGYGSPDARPSGRSPSARWRSIPRRATSPPAPWGPRSRRRCVSCAAAASAASSPRSTGSPRPSTEESGPSSRGTPPPRHDRLNQHSTNTEPPTGRMNDRARAH